MATPNKTQITQTSAENFLAQLDMPTRCEEGLVLIALFERLTGEAATMWGPSIVGFGVNHYTYESGREGTAPMVAFSPRKAHLVFYGLDGGNLSPDVAARLGKHSTGKGCLYAKKLSDIDTQVLSDLVAVAWASHKVQE